MCRYPYIQIETWSNECVSYQKSIRRALEDAKVRRKLTNLDTTCRAELPPCLRCGHLFEGKRLNLNNEMPKCETFRLCKT